MLQEIIRDRKNEWINAPACPVASDLAYIRAQGSLREPQIQAIETYLFLKIAGENKPIWKLISEGFFSRQEDLKRVPLTELQRQLLATNPAAKALFEMRASFPEFEKMVLREDAETIDYEAVIRKMFYEVDYTDYLFSLPMGAGKTFLMAAFIYLDLYYARLYPENKAFAHNFIVMAPSGLKSSIIPSLKSIERFDPTWVLPANSAAQIRRMLKFEVLDQPKSAQKSNQTRNPNLAKVAGLKPIEDLMGAILVVNAEKVILDKVEKGKDPTLFDVHQTEDEKSRYANELRHWIGKIPNLAILIDEVHHAATDDVKLRQVVNTWHQKGAVTNVLGFSGTPYLSSPEKITVGAGTTLKLSLISNTVFYYPLIEAVRTFLKKPLVKVEKGAHVTSLNIIQTGVTAFMESFGATTYADGTCAKLAIYCSSIEKLEEIIFPFLVTEMGISEAAILKYHQGNKKHPARKESHTEFLNLDTPFSNKKIVLLVQIGKEGWDCRSLTGVILSQKGDCPTNMVLQTACRCLRQVQYAAGVPVPDKTALICLNEDNEKSLDKQLKDEQHISLAELGNVKPRTDNPAVRPRVSRVAHLGLPKVEFYQLKVHFEELALETDPHTPDKLTALQNVEHEAIQVEDRELTGGAVTSRRLIHAQAGEPAQFDYWLLQIVKESLGSVTMPDLRLHTVLLQAIFDRITLADATGQRFFNTLFPIGHIQSGIRKAFRCRREMHVREQEIHEKVELLIVENLKPVLVSNKLYPPEPVAVRILKADERKVDAATVLAEDNAVIEAMHAQMEAMGMGNMRANMPLNVLSPPEAHKDHTLHYLPYQFDSNFEREVLEKVLQDADFQQLGLEIYFNGEGTLTRFSIDCYHRNGSAPWRSLGSYSPDFLIIQRTPDRTDIRRILIVETKGAGFARNFTEKRWFMEHEFVTRNNIAFGYNRFDFLYLQDDDPQLLQTLSLRLHTFFAA